tara:strand:+ start:225 stop:626 length:402 start_codon:yes stop_codon:yes gene_type:complete
MIDYKILSIASNTKFVGLKNKFTHKCTKKSVKCGDKIKIEIITKKDKIATMRYETESCIYCQASASILANKIKILSISSMKNDFKLIEKVIKNKEFTLPKKLYSFNLLVNKGNINRFDCIMLPFNALKKALNI